MLTLKSVNRELQKTFPDFELVKGDGYFYIWGPNCESWQSSMIYTNTINQLTLQQWMESCASVIITGNEYIEEKL